MSKAAVTNMTQSFAAYFAPGGVRVNAVAPGFIATEMTEVLSEDYMNKMKEMIPLGKLGTTKDIANLVLFLAGNQSDYITGQVIHVDGGMVM